MTVSDKNKKNNGAKSNISEIKLRARAVARGVAIGKVVCLHGRKRQFYRINLDESQIDSEFRRFRAAVRLAKRQLKKISSFPATDGKNSKSSIFEAHLLILEDKSFLEKIEKNLRAQARLVEQLLDYSQIIAGTVKLDGKDINFSDVFENTFSEIEPTAQEKSIQLIKNNHLNGHLIMGDEDKIKLVIHNLLTN
ncbi:MAG: phosphoenolpyruvate-utilizing N-terminal domain-containing protein, partial [Actinomycetota bacterium]